MIPLSLREIAAVAGGTVEGDGAVTVTAPAVLDGRQAEPGGLFVAFVGEHADGHDYADQAGRAGAVAVLGSRPTPLPTVVVEDAQAALQALAAHVVVRLRDRLAVAGLTGSQGKTSTKDLLAAVLSGAAPTIATIGSLNNELGVPLTMLRADAATRYLVLEMGARRIGDIAGLTGLAAPDIAVVLNVGQAHLGKFGSAIEGGRRIAVLGEMLELGDDSEAEHRAVGEYAASRADVVAAVGEAARPIADGAGERAVSLAGNDAAVDWLRGHLAVGDVVLVKASREARLDEVAAALT